MKPASKPSLSTAYALVERAGEHLSELNRLHDEVIAAYAKATVVHRMADRTIGPGEGKLVAMVESGHEQAPIPNKVRVLVGEISNSLNLR